MASNITIIATVNSTSAKVKPFFLFLLVLISFLSFLFNAVTFVLPLLSF